MATATHERPEPAATITLVLSEDEALYVYGALNRATPTDDRFGDGGADPVYDALLDALVDAGVKPTVSYAVSTTVASL